MNQDTMHDYTQLMEGSVWNKEVICSPESVISFLNDSGTFRSFGGGSICTITQKMPNLADCTPKEITKYVLSLFDDIYFYNNERIQLKTGRTPMEVRCAYVA